MATSALYACLKHGAGHRLDAFSPGARIEIGGSRVTFTVTRVAGSCGGGRGSHRFVLDLDVTVRAFDLVIRHVSPVHELGLAVAAQSRRIIVAGVATLARNFAGALDNVCVTRRALHVEAFYVVVVEGQIRLGGDLARNLVAERAAAGSLIELLALEVTEETRRLGHCDVASLNDL